MEDSLTNSQAESGDAVTPENPERVPATSESDTATEVVSLFVALLEQDPELAAKIADTIEQHYSGGVSDYMVTPTPNLPAGGTMAEFTASTASVPAAPAAPVSSTTPSPTAAPETPNSGSGLPEEFIQRLERLEISQAEAELDRELAAVRDEYNKLKEQLPVLPDLNEQEILQIAYDRGGLPLKDAFNIWVAQALMSAPGEGSIADRIVAAVMQKSKTNTLPRVEGRGGSIPSGEGAKPTSVKEANAMVKDLIKAMRGFPG